jgi:hypothetical protein
LEISPIVPPSGKRANIEFHPSNFFFPRFSYLGIEHMFLDTVAFEHAIVAVLAIELAGRG